MPLAKGPVESEAINLNTIDFLVSAEAARAARAFAETAFPGDAAAALTALRRQYTPEQAGALLALVRLRQVARAKFPQADRLFFTRAALEQATAHEIALYRARKLDALAPGGPVLDLGSGIGGDALALAQLRPVIAYEQDPLRARILQENTMALGYHRRISVHLEEWQAALETGKITGAAAAFLDPPRRAGERRLMRLAQVLPSWQPIRDLMELVGVVCLKLMPGIADTEIPTGARVEFISHEGSCKEAVLWLGADIEPGREAAVHDGERWHLLAAGGTSPPVGELKAGQILYEPDPAVIRAGPFSELCTQLDAHLFDSQIAYLVSRDEGAHPRPTPFASAFRIEEVHRYSLKRLNERVQALQIGTVELKKRGVPFEPESLRNRLRLKTGGDAAVVIFTRHEDARLMLIARRVAGSRAGPAVS